MKIKKFFKKNYKFLIFVIAWVVLFYVKLPYYIMAPGGTINITNRVVMDGYSLKEGSVNMLYVSEYEATPIIYLYALAKGYDINKNEDKKISDETLAEAEERNKLMRDNSLDIALMLAYNKAGKKIEINSKKNIVIAKDKNNGLMVGDIILEADGNLVQDVSEIKSLISVKNVDDYITFKIIRNNEEKTVRSKIYEYEGKKVVGVVIITDYDYDMEPKFDLKFKNNEKGPSGGVMLALTIYSALVEDDIINGRNIAGTGTISYDGTVGEIDGIKYKIMGAYNDGMDLVFVPSANYEEAINTKKKYNYKMEIVKVDNFDDVLKYLNK